MIKVLFYVLCYLAIGIVLQMLAIWLLETCSSDGTLVTGLNESKLDNEILDNYEWTEEDAEELFCIRKPYLWLNILLWPLNVIYYMYKYIRCILRLIKRD